MLGFKKFYNARRVIMGIELAQKIHKIQFALPPPHTSPFRKHRRLYYWIPAGVLAIAAAYLAFVYIYESRHP
jgi:hypothetical protein